LPSMRYVPRPGRRVRGSRDVQERRLARARGSDDRRSHRPGARRRGRRRAGGARAGNRRPYVGLTARASTARNGRWRSAGAAEGRQRTGQRPSRAHGCQRGRRSTGQGRRRGCQPSRPGGEECVPSRQGARSSRAAGGRSPAGPDTVCWECAHDGAGPAAGPLDSVGRRAGRSRPDPAPMDDVWSAETSRLAGGSGADTSDVWALRRRGRS